MFALLHEIDSAVKIQAWVLDLMGLVAIPDICGALESENGWATKDKYFTWFGKYLGAHYPELGAEEFYKVRNSMLHTGNSRGRVGRHRLPPRRRGVGPQCRVH